MLGYTLTKYNTPLSSISSGCAREPLLMDCLLVAPQALLEMRPTLWSMAPRPTNGLPGLILAMFRSSWIMLQLIPPLVFHCAICPIPAATFSAIDWCTSKQEKKEDSTYITWLQSNTQRS